MVDSQIYSDNVGLVIQNLEGGYFHPNMLKDGRVKDSRYKKSGETMFGIDRANGDKTASGWNQFWGLIDNAGAKDKWEWNYMGGDLAPQLKDLAAQIMKPQYDSLSTQHLTPQAKALVDSDPRLLFNFIYATWNGGGWFRYFASKVNAAVAKGITNLDELVKVAIDARTNQDAMKAYGWHADAASLISQGGNKIASLVDRIKQSAGQDVADVEESISTATTKSIETIKKNPVILVAGVVLIGFSLFLVYKFNQTSTQTT